MSEYQYYEFLAVDRPLTKAEMAEVRALSTRATITPTRFQNVYHWGDFKGDPLVLMERYYDAFVYVANWGSHQLMLRLPHTALSAETARHYCAAEPAATAHVKGDHLILAFSSEDEEGDFDEGGEEWMPALLGLRADLAAGDLRPLYIAWLRCVQEELLDGGAVEPPVPPGLGELSAPLRAFADFMRIDADLLAVAATRSGPLKETRLSAVAVASRIRGMPEAEKDALLLRLARGQATQAQAALLRLLRGADQPPGGLEVGDASGRTVAALLAAVEQRSPARRA